MFCCLLTCWSSVLFLCWSSVVVFLNVLVECCYFLICWTSVVVFGFAGLVLFCFNVVVYCCLCFNLLVQCCFFLFFLSAFVVSKSAFVESELFCPSPPNAAGVLFLF